jgi:ubiquinol-cytochrome c reductase cytochrome c1 subunit
VKKILKLFSVIILFCVSSVNVISAEKVEYLKTDWTFKGLFGKFDRA